MLGVARGQTARVKLIVVPNLFITTTFPQKYNPITFKLRNRSKKPRRRTRLQP